MKDIKKEEIENLSYKDITYLILEKAKKGINTLELFTKIIDILELPKSTVENKIADYYTSLATDKRFILIDSVWDLRKRHTSDKVIIDNIIEDDEETSLENKDDESIVEDEYDDEYTDNVDVNNDFDDNDDLSDLVVLDEEDLS